MRKVALFRRKTLDRETTLKTRPRAIDGITWSEEEDGEVVIELPRRETALAKVLSVVFYLPRARKLRLDELGSFVWQRCDGRTSMRRIIAEFAREYKLHPKEAEISVMVFAQTLVRKGIVELLPTGRGAREDR